MKRCLIVVLVLLSFISCKNDRHPEDPKPNVLWIVTEDISPTLSFYGDTTAKTPHLDALAHESMVYENAFTTVGVCAPSRSSIITGMYPTSIGTMHMRTGKDVHSWGKRVYNKDMDIKDLSGKQIVQYSAVIPSYVRCFTEYLRMNGYFTSNNQKTDYQFAAPVTAWDQNNVKAHWRNRPKNAPFFSVFNIGITHESRLWLNEKLPLTVNPSQVKVPPYLPDNKETRNTIARNYSNIELMDKKVGEIIQQLKDDGLYDNTIIFFYSDHGGPLPRQKREILDSGLRVPLLIKGIGEKSGRTHRLVSFVDLAPTMLSLAGIEPPKYMEGKAFLGLFQAAERQFVFGSSDRFDEHTDRIRAIRTKEFLYLKNDFPDKSRYKDVGYRKNIPMMKSFLELESENGLNVNQKRWFEKKTEEELYDVVKDPHQLHNLRENLDFQSELVKLRTLMHQHMDGKKDLGLLPEAELIQQMWPNFQQPNTANVILKKVDGKIELSSTTKGSSIAYITSEVPLQNLDFNSAWQLYANPIKQGDAKYIYTIAQRIGFKESQIAEYKLSPQK